MLTVVAASFAVLAWRAVDPSAIAVKAQWCARPGFGSACDSNRPVPVRVDEWPEQPGQRLVFAYNLART